MAEQGRKTAPATWALAVLLAGLTLFGAGCRCQRRRSRPTPKPAPAAETLEETWHKRRAEPSPPPPVIAPAPGSAAAGGAGPEGRTKSSGLFDLLGPAGNGGVGSAGSADGSGGGWRQEAAPAPAPSAGEAYERSSPDWSDEAPEPGGIEPESGTGTTGWRD